MGRLGRTTGINVQVARGGPVKPGHDGMRPHVSIFPPPETRVVTRRVASVDG
jgi:hypothetical protein